MPWDLNLNSHSGEVNDQTNNLPVAGWAKRLLASIKLLKFMEPADNFKRIKKSKRKYSLDGFISPESFKKPHGSLEFRPRGRLGQDKNTQIGNFDQPDGYQPTIPALAGTEEQSSTLPDGPRQRFSSSDLHNPKKPKRRLRGFLSKLRPRKPKSWKKFFKQTALTIGLLILLVAGFLGYKLYTTQRKVLSGGGQAPAVCDGNVPISKLHKEGDSRVNILLVGIGGPGHDGPDLTDTIIIASVDTINHEVELLSIPRDLWVQIPGQGINKINSAYPNAKNASTAKKLVDREKTGLSLLDQLVSQVSGIPIHYNVLVDFKAFRDSVNAVGGVRVNVPETLYDPTVAWENHNNPIIAKKGLQKFNGAQALLYARSRETSSDFARGERQRLLIVALKDRVLSLGTFSNPIKISSLLDSFGNNVYTNFDLGSIKCLYKQGSEIQSSNIKSLDLVTPPHALLTTGNISGLSVVYPRAGLFNYSAIQTFVRNTLRDSELKKENANVMVLNGTNITGLATKEAEILKSYGYNVGTTGDTPTHNYQSTIVVNLRGDVDKYTQNYLEQRFGVKATDKLPDSSINAGTADFVIILGADATNSSQN